MGATTAAAEAIVRCHRFPESAHPGFPTDEWL